MASQSANSSHRGMDFGIPIAVDQNVQSPSDDTASVPAGIRVAYSLSSDGDLIRLADESASIPIATTGISGPELPHGNAERDSGPATPAPQQPLQHDDTSATSGVGADPTPKAKAKAAPKSKFGLEDVKRCPANVNLGPIRPGGGKRRGATLSPQRSSGRKPLLEPLTEEPTPNPTASSSQSQSAPAEPEPAATGDSRPDSHDDGGEQRPTGATPMSPISIVPPSPTAEAQLHAAVTVESLAHRVAVLEKILTERVLAIDDRLQVIKFEMSEANDRLSEQIGRLEEQGHDLSERLTELEVKIVDWKAPKVPETFNVSTPNEMTPTLERSPMPRPEVNPMPTMPGRPTMSQNDACNTPTMMGQPVPKQEAQSMPTLQGQTSTPQPRMQATPTMAGQFMTQVFSRHVRGGTDVKFSAMAENSRGPCAQEAWTTQPAFGFHARGPSQSSTTTWAPQHPQTPVAPSSVGVGRSLHKEVTYVIDRKNAGDMPVFSGRIVDYEKWVERVIEHLCSTCSRWRSVLDTARKAQTPHEQYQLMNTQIDGFNAWEIAVELGQFTFRHLHKDLYDDKYALCGGPELNGFELWRNLEKRYGGGGRAVEVSGLAAFMSFPSCEAENNLVSHLARWEEYLNRYGSELRRTPESLRVMLLNVLPKEMGDKLRPKRMKYPTFQSILAYVRERHEERVEIAKAEAIHLPVQPKRTGRVNAVTGQQNSPSYSAVASGSNVQQQQQQVQMPSMQDLQEMMAAVSGARNPKGNAPAPNAFRRFIFKGCWECGKEGHSRHACPDWKRILDKEGRPPAGHKGAKDKAFAKWKLEKAVAAKKNQINFLGERVVVDDNTEDEDDERDQVDEFGLRHLKVMVEPVKLSNSFDALADQNPENQLSDEVVEAMNTFAHRLHIGKKTSQRTRRPKEDFTAVLKEFKGDGAVEKGQPLILRRPEDLDRPDVKQVIQPLPQEPERINRLAALCPGADEVPLQPGERWILFDTGASCNALNVARDCPQYKDKIRQTSNSLSGRGAESASGGSIPEKGEVLVDMMIDGHACQMTFKDMDVSMPITSGRACVGGGDTFAIIHQNGGSLKNITTGKEIKLYARQGVYFFRAAILAPDSLAPDLTSPFARQG